MGSFKHGDIVLIRLNGTSATDGNESTRHAVIISADIINENLQTVIVCPLIEAKQVSQSRIGATFVPKADIGLDRDGLVFSLQIKTVSKDRIVKRVSSLPLSYMEKIKESLQAVLELDT